MSIFGLEFSNTDIVLFSIFAVIFLIQISYYFFVFLRVGRFKGNTETTNERFPVSIVICAQNEEKNIAQNLPLILEQDYPKYEVIVVNDCSEDETEMVLSEMVAKYKHLHITSIPKDKKFRHGKKLALTVGIKAAKNEWVLLTDADCKPSDANWLQRMQANFIDSTDVVLGYGPHKPQKGLLNNIIRFDTFFIGLQYLGFALAKKPYMGVGRNLAYRKSLFFEMKGFAKHSHIVSGDDDLFINQLKKKSSVKVELAKDSFTYSAAKNNFTDWWKQKKRHLSTGHLYSSKSKFFLGVEVASRFFFYTMFIGLLFFPILWIPALLVFGVRMIIQLIVFKIGMNRLNEKNLFIPSLLYDVVLPIINLFAFLSNVFTRNKNTWI